MSIPQTSRWEPFKVLFEAQYLPLLLLALPQSFIVYKWLNTDTSLATMVFAIIGAAAFESAYVGSIAWADRQTKGKWIWVTAFIALLFSVLVAIKVNMAREGWWALLHAGFPLTAFAYTMIMHHATPSIDIPSLVTERDVIRQENTELVNQLTRREATELSLQIALDTVTSERDDARQHAQTLQRQVATVRQPRPLSLDEIAHAIYTNRWQLPHLVAALDKLNPNQSETAALLGTSRQSYGTWLAKAQQNGHGEA